MKLAFPLPQPPPPERLAGRQEEGRRVGGVLDISWRPQRGAPLSPGRSGLPEAPGRLLSNPGIAGVVLRRLPQLESRALFPDQGRSGNGSCADPPYSTRLVRTGLHGALTCLEVLHVLTGCGLRAVLGAGFSQGGVCVSGKP